MNCSKKPLKISEEILVRPMRSTDARDLYHIFTHPLVAHPMHSLPVTEFAVTEEWIKEPKPGQHRLVAQIGDKVVGSATITQFQRARLIHSGKLGLMVSPEHWNRGVGTRLMAAILDLADNWLNLNRIGLEVFSDNPQAIHLYEKFGFVTEGTRRCAAFGNGCWMDELVMARLRGLDDSLSSQPDTTTHPLFRPSSNVKGNKATIRTVQQGDVEDLFAIFSHPSVGRTTLQMPSQEISLSEKRVAKSPRGFYRYVAEVDGKAVAAVSIYHKDNPREAHAAGLGMSVHPDYWGQGIGSQLMEAMIDLADNWLNFKRLDLEVNTDNVAGIKLYQKYDFEIEGTYRFHAFGDGRWADSYFMARVRV
jgi:putative acetyltransferase